MCLDLDVGKRRQGFVDVESEIASSRDPAKNWDNYSRSVRAFRNGNTRLVIRDVVALEMDECE